MTSVIPTSTNSLQALFVKRFGTHPKTAVRAPGRVDLMGSHTDYNLGSVCTAAIDREIQILASPRTDRCVQAISLNLSQEALFDLNDPGAVIPDWCEYIRGTLKVAEKKGFETTGVNMLIHSTIPMGSGLSSSAAFEVAVFTMLENLTEHSIPLLEKARLCQKAENDAVGVQCGILDQYSVIFGRKNKVLLLDCRETSHRYAGVPEGLNLVVCNTCAPRRLAGSEYGKRRAQCESVTRFFQNCIDGILGLCDVPMESFKDSKQDLDPVEARRAQFILEEHARVAALSDALASSDFDQLAELGRNSFEGAATLFEITVPEMHQMMESIRTAPGCISARQAGAGFGGCLTAWVQAEAVDAFIHQTASNYRDLTGIDPELYPVHIAEGASDIILPSLEKELKL